MLNRHFHIYLRSHSLTSLDVSRSHFVIQIMAFKCIKIRLKEIDSATENVTGILDHQISVTGHMWTSMMIILDVSKGLNYFHNTCGEALLSLNKDPKHHRGSKIMVVILHL